LQTTIGCRLFTSAYFLYKRYIEDDLYHLLRSFPLLVSGGNVLDVGANIGYTSTVFARAIESSQKVYAFEPEHFNFSILQQTAGQPEFEGKIIATQCAVGANDGTVELWINDHHHADHRVVTDRFRAEHQGARSVNTALVSIDSFLRYKKESISFVKIDVQGYELAVCLGMEETLRENPSLTVFLEFMPSGMRDLGFEPSQLIDFFVGRGFDIYVVHRGGKLSRGMPSNIGDLGYCNLLFSRRPIMSFRQS
jgi:FkbM family methyltransferase